MNAERIERMRRLLADALAPESIDVRDDSHLHIGHEGARGGAGHYHVHIVSGRFAGRSRVQRHQMIYAALGSLMHGEVHALGIAASTPAESLRGPHTT